MSSLRLLPGYKCKALLVDLESGKWEGDHVEMEKLDAERNQNSSRQILWRNLNDRKKSGRMVRRIYNKTREEMADSRRAKCREWIDNANADMRSWVREPQTSVFQHTFRDRQREAEIGPSNGHVSGRKYVPRYVPFLRRLAFTGGGELDKEKTMDLMETLLEPSRMRGNNPTALHNPCRPSVMVNDTAMIRGRIEHPHWEPPQYFLRPREKAKEIGPDVQYADRNDMQRLFSAVVKNSLFAWGEYEEQGVGAAPTCRRESPKKWMGDQPFHPGFRYRDGQRESMAGEKYSPDILNTGDYKNPRGYSRERYPKKELPRHKRFQLVVKCGEYACPDGDTRRSLRFVAEPPEPYPEGKMYFASLRSVPVKPMTEKVGAASSIRPRDSALCKSRSLGTLPRGGRIDGSPALGGASVRSTGNQQAERNTGHESLGNDRLLVSRSSTAVRFSGESGRTVAGEEDLDKSLTLGEVQGIPGASTAPGSAENASTEERCGDGKLAGNMRRGSEMATWAICGTREKSARDYLW